MKARIIILLFIVCLQLAVAEDEVSIENMDSGQLKEFFNEAGNVEQYASQYPGKYKEYLSGFSDEIAAAIQNGGVSDSDVAQLRIEGEKLIVPSGSSVSFSNGLPDGAKIWQGAQINVYGTPVSSSNGVLSSQSGFLMNNEGGMCSVKSLPSDVNGVEYTKEGWVLKREGGDIDAPGNAQISIAESNLDDGSSWLNFRKDGEECLITVPKDSSLTINPEDKGLVFNLDGNRLPPISDLDGSRVNFENRGDITSVFVNGVMLLGDIEKIGGLENMEITASKMPSGPGMVTSGVKYNGEDFDYEFKKPNGCFQYSAFTWDSIENINGALAPLAEDGTIFNLYKGGLSSSVQIKGDAYDFGNVEGSYVAGALGSGTKIIKKTDNEDIEVKFDEDFDVFDCSGNADTNNLKGKLNKERSGLLMDDRYFNIASDVGDSLYTKLSHTLNSETYVEMVNGNSKTVTCATGDGFNVDSYGVKVDTNYNGIKGSGLVEIRDGSISTVIQADKNTVINPGNGLQVKVSDMGQSFELSDKSADDSDVANYIPENGEINLAEDFTGILESTGGELKLEFKKGKLQGKSISDSTTQVPKIITPDSIIEVVGGAEGPVVKTEDNVNDQGYNSNSAPVKMNTKTYEVQKGDTLSQIALEAGVSVKELQNLNVINNPDLIRIGQELEVPVSYEESSSAPVKMNTKTYEVQKGDTLSEIANEAGVSWQKLQDLNELDDPDQIQVGEVIKIPEESKEVSDDDDKEEEETVKILTVKQIIDRVMGVNAEGETIPGSDTDAEADASDDDQDTSLQDFEPNELKVDKSRNVVYTQENEDGDSRRIEEKLEEVSEDFRATEDRKVAYLTPKKNALTTDRLEVIGKKVNSMKELTGQKNVDSEHDMGIQSFGQDEHTSIYKGDDGNLYAEYKGEVEEVKEFKYGPRCAEFKVGWFKTRVECFE